MDHMCHDLIDVSVAFNGFVKTIRRKLGIVTQLLFLHITCIFIL
jgi:hypothetical protein